MDKDNDKRNKITIFTIFASNYGAILQAFALQKYIKLKHPEQEVYLCNSFGETKPDFFSRKYSPSGFKNVLIKGLVAFRYGSLVRSYRRKEQFKKEEFQLCTLEDIKGSSLYLTGSDQVFNPTVPKREVFFQDFSKDDAIKAAYAPSFGVESFPNNFVSYVKPLLVDFDYLSCREQSGADFIASITGKTVPHVCDPTLLLSSDIWHFVASRNKYGKYIFIYDLNGGQNLIDIALVYKRITNLKIVCLTQKPQRFYKGVDYQIYDSGPREFVGLFENAQYVVTDSFHGLMFSLIFNRPFSLHIASKQTASRILEVVHQLGIEDSVLSSSDNTNELPKAMSQDTISKLSAFINNSKSFINSVLDNACSKS